LNVFQNKRSDSKVRNYAFNSEFKINKNPSILEMCDNLANNYYAKSLIYKNQNIELSEISAEKQNNIVEKINNKDVEKSIMEFFAFKNENYSSFLYDFILSICFIKKKRDKINMLEKYADKINSKFDIFDYLKNIRQLQLFKILCLSEEEKNLISLLSRKLYIVNTIEDQQENIKSIEDIRKEDKLKAYFKANLDVMKQEKLLKLILWFKKILLNKSFIFHNNKLKILMINKNAIFEKYISWKYWWLLKC